MMTDPELSSNHSLCSSFSFSSKLLVQVTNNGLKSPQCLAMKLQRCPLQRRSSSWVSFSWALLFSFFYYHCKVGLVLFFLLSLQSFMFSPVSPSSRSISSSNANLLISTSRHYFHSPPHLCVRFNSFTKFVNTRVLFMTLVFSLSQTNTIFQIYSIFLLTFKI